MLLDMTVSNFRSIGGPQTISCEAVKDNRLAESKVLALSEKLKVIKTSAIIGPNGAGKSAFVRALEAVKMIVTAEPETENPLQILAGTSFAYSEMKGGPASMLIDIVTGTDEETGQPIIGRYTLLADRQHIYEETYYLIIGRSRKLMFERKLVEGTSEQTSYHYRWGKMFRGEKKRLVGKVPPQHTYLGTSARKGSASTLPLYTWLSEELLILPFGLSALSEKGIVDQLNAHPEWKKQLINFLWSFDITDIRDVRMQDNKLIFVHTNVTQHYASYFVTESLSLRRLTSIAIALFESFVSKRCLIIDDFGMLLHPFVLEHVVKVFESCSADLGSQLFVVDCTPSLLKDGVLRRDAIWFAQKDAQSATVYYSLADFKFSRSKKAMTEQFYLQGAYGSLPIMSEFVFTDDGKKER